MTPNPRYPWKRDQTVHPDSKRTIRNKQRTITRRLQRQVKAYVSIYKGATL